MRIASNMVGTPVRGDGVVQSPPSSLSSPRSMPPSPSLTLTQATNAAVANGRPYQKPPMAKQATAATVKQMAANMVGTPRGLGATLSRCSPVVTTSYTSPQDHLP